ncbi:MAG: replicative DNA helicase [candidate division Zixibacteria bacterium 4484_95]|nr:MAG: replicative DNA helicase [candidate division Zixibacteria bacterium 4484_95]
MAEAVGKIPPQSIEAEQAVLGAMLLSKDAVDIGIELLNANYFYKPSHRKIFKAIVDLYDKNEPADLITVSNELANRGQLDEIGGRAYLAGLTDATPGISNIEHHAKIILEKAVLNQLIETAASILSEAYEPNKVIDEFLDAAEQKIFAIKEGKLKVSFSSLSEILPETFHNIEQYAQREGYVTGQPSGFSELDNLTSGFQKSDLIVVASRPTVGKTAFSLNIAEYLAVEKKVPVMIFSLEMSKEQVAQRMLCSRARVSSHLMRTGRLADDQWTNLSIAVGPLSEAPIFIDDTPTMTVLEMRAKARRLKSRENIELVIVDYLQLIQGPRNVENRQQEISFISRSLKALARELKVPVIALSQLSRQVELRGKDARPQLSDLRESGAIEQDADVVIFIHRNRDSEGHLGAEADIIIGKQRNGPTGIVHLAFVKDYARFELLDIYHGYPESESETPVF